MFFLTLNLPGNTHLIFCRDDTVSVLKGYGNLKLQTPKYVTI